MLASGQSTIMLLVLISYAVLMGASQILMVNAAKEVGENLSLYGLIYALFCSPWLYIAITTYIIATGIWLAILYRVDIRIAYPIASTAVIFAILIQCFSQKSFPSFTYWVGIILVLTGIVLIQRENL